MAAECQSAGYPGTLIPFKCDLSNEEEILSMFSAIKTLHQGVDVCINNAGVARPEPLLSGKTDGWRTMIDVSRGFRLSEKQTQMGVNSPSPALGYVLHRYPCGTKHQASYMMEDTCIEQGGFVWPGVVSLLCKV